MIQEKHVLLHSLDGWVAEDEFIVLELGVQNFPAGDGERLPAEQKELGTAAYLMKWEIVGRILR